MNEAKWELNNLNKWKKTVKLLEETKDDLRDMRVAIVIDPNSLPGGSAHETVFNKMNRIVEQCANYDVIIKNYNFMINRIEKAMDELLNVEQKEVCYIYANYSESIERESVASKKGYTRASYYRILNKSLEILNEALLPSDTNLRLKQQ